MAEWPLRALVNAMREPSGDQSGAKSLAGSNVIWRTLVPSSFMMKMSLLLLRRDRNAISLPSGLHEALKSVNVSDVSWRLSVPSTFMTHSSAVAVRPPRVHTMRRPSGENSEKSSSTLSSVSWRRFVPSPSITQMSQWPPRSLENTMGAERAARADGARHSEVSRSAAAGPRAAWSVARERDMGGLLASCGAPGRIDASGREPAVSRKRVDHSDPRAARSFQREALRARGSVGLCVNLFES